MHRKVTNSAIGIVLAMVLGTLSIPSQAQDSPSSTIDTPNQTGPGYEASGPSDQPYYMQRLDDRPWGNLPRTQRRDQPQPRGAQGPIRSDDGMRTSGSRWQALKDYMHQPVGNRGEQGFLNWRETNTDTP
ncbi:MAG TPA: hypothetical protein VFF03_19635 [Rhodocyclaceae bacterium]|nr:hypothetical protein [Rhodocyclaceae bacterium]